MAATYLPCCAYHGSFGVIVKTLIVSLASNIAPPRPHPRHRLVRVRIRATATATASVHLRLRSPFKTASVRLRLRLRSAFSVQDCDCERSSSSLFSVLCSVSLLVSVLISAQSLVSVVPLSWLIAHHVSVTVSRLRKQKMKIVSVALRSLNGNLSHRFHQTHLLRSLSTWTFSGNQPAKQQDSKSESLDEFEQRIFGAGGNSQNDYILEKLNWRGKARDRSSSVDGGSSQVMPDLEQSFDTLSDGMDGKLKDAAQYFEIDQEEYDKEDYAFRYDTTFHSGGTYTIKDLDLTKPGGHKPPARSEFQVTTKEVLSQADFRNVRFLANFITDAGIIIKRSQTGISAKAQRKVAREIKTARAFGLIPFTTMGTKSFVFGRTMENLDDDFAYRSEISNMHEDFDMDGENA
ncbi:Ribosomal protein S18 [Sesbania bispinosa]|nr:Ribosomal protein S18 [Sesbania bispinosa]